MAKKLTKNAKRFNRCLRYKKEKCVTRDTKKQKNLRKSKKSKKSKKITLKKGGGISVYPKTYLAGDCTRTKADRNGNFNCHEKYILDIDKNIIRRCHNKKNLMGSIVGCNNIPYNPRNKTIKYNFTMQDEITINKTDLTIDKLHLTEQEVIIDKFSIPFNEKFSSVILIKNRSVEDEATGVAQGLPHRYIIITPDNTTVMYGNTRAMDIEQFNLDLTITNIGSFRDMRTVNLTIRYFIQVDP